MTDERDTSFAPAHAAPAPGSEARPAHAAGTAGTAATAPSDQSASPTTPAAPIAPASPEPIGTHAAPAAPANAADAPRHFAEPANPTFEEDGEAELFADAAPLEAEAADASGAAGTDIGMTPGDPLAPEDPDGQREPDATAPAPASAPAAAAPAEPAASPLESVPDPVAPVSPEDTAEIDVDAVEAALAEPAPSDPGSTQSFAPLTEERIDTDSTYDAGTTTSLMWGARSDVGCVRGHNEDSYLVQSPLFCVCDGMGGHAAGEVASSIAVETIARMAPKTADPALLGAAIEAANAAIIEAAVNGLGKPGMGCTATAAYIEGTSLAIAHVGDSRAYLLHEGTLIRVTRDHSYVEELVDAGEITADEARVHPNRSVITRALGSDPYMYADHFQLNVEEGDRLILCSDGLSSMIPDGDIETIATQSSTAQICTDNLVDAALAAGGSDNVTVIVIDVVDDGHLAKLVSKRRRIVAIGLVALIALVLLAGIVTFVSVTNSVYLGVKDEAVAIYKGVPNRRFGLKLSWLEDETSVLLEDLPEDTQNRLSQGIPQESLEDAEEAIENYREQIDASKNSKAATAEAIRGESDDAGAATGAGDSVAPSSGANPAGRVAPSRQSDQGGDGR